MTHGIQTYLQPHMPNVYIGDISIIEYHGVK